MSAADRIRAVLGTAINGPGSVYAVDGGLLRDALAELVAHERRREEGKPNEFRTAKAEKMGDVRYWTAEDALLEALEFVREDQAKEDKNIRAVILWEVFDRTDPDGDCKRWSRLAQVTKSRAISMMEWAKYELMHGGK